MKKRSFFFVLLFLVFLLTISFVAAKTCDYECEEKKIYRKTTTEKWEDYWEARSLSKREYMGEIKITFYEKGDYGYKYYNYKDYDYKTYRDYKYKKPEGWIRKKRVCKDAGYYLGQHDCK